MSSSRSPSRATSSKRFDIAIVGAGILGITITYWLSTLYDCSIALIDKEEAVARHTSSRNTGIIHRPFYLNPEKKKVFASAAQKAYYLWSSLASKYNLTWKQVGTLEVATNEKDLGTLDQYKRWAQENGMEDWETSVLDSGEVQKIEPLVKCAGAIFSKTDTAVDYGELSNFVFDLARKNRQVNFIGGFEVDHLEQTAESVRLSLRGKADKSKTLEITCNFLINAAGGGAIDIAHKLGLAKSYTDLHFRGEYWLVDEPFASKISRNVYSVPKYKEFPFLDPHFIVRASGRREIGPNAVLVFGPNAYRGFSEGKKQIIEKIFERPNLPKIRLFTSGTFLSLAAHEWKSSISKKAMCDRVRRFIPSLDPSLLTRRGLWREKLSD
jgi:(S)-2-hydroxyglutarate dehydrogenase